jgi:hypothetical protein
MIDFELLGHSPNSTTNEVSTLVTHHNPWASKFSDHLLKHEVHCCLCAAIFFWFLIQVDIGGHPPFSTCSKQFSGNFGNLLFLAVFNFQGHFEGQNEFFKGQSFSMIFKGSD